MEYDEIIENAKAVLEANDSGKFTRPAPGLYPHQWLWDSCFTAIGISRYAPHRAAQEIYSLLEGQWKNGMIPHMIFADGTGKEESRGHIIGANFWQSQRSPDAPTHRQTSGITQPPVVAEACLRIAENMSKKEAHAFLGQVFDKIVLYHEWLYRERDPDSNGTVALLHPWETGLDNAPGWMEELKHIHSPLWFRSVRGMHLDFLLEKMFRRDTKHVKSEERMSTANALLLTHVALSLRKRNYDIKRILRRPHFVIESLSFNSILIGNNLALERIADIIHRDLPDGLLSKFELAKKGIEGLWSEEKQQYCHRNHLTSELIAVPGIATLLPLYSGAITKKRAKQLVSALKDEERFWLPYPVPSVAKNSRYFNPRRYWQGPTWINTNWMIIDGLRKYGYTNEADHIKRSSMELIQKSGFHEYFSPLDGKGAGTDNFSWTAALILDLASEKD